MFKRTLITTLVLALALTLNACGGGSGSPATGEVAVVVTDGPTDQYQRMLITMVSMTLIGPGGHVELYNGPEITFDLLKMSEWADLAFTTKVLAGRYNKIRIELSKVELIDLADSNNNVVLDKLPANGKIDLNPRGSFEVSPDYTTVIKLDMDARRSFQVVETGNNKLQLRPIIFVEIFQDSIFLPERLVRIAGQVEAGSIVDTDTDDSFRLCDLQFISQSSGPSLGSASDCVKVYADSSTSFFDDMGEATDFLAIIEGERLTAVGFITDTDDAEAFLGLNAAVLELGPRKSDSIDGWETSQGVVVDDPTTCDTTDQCFNFTPAGSDPTITVLVPTRMRPETRVFRADGVELSQADVNMGDSGSVDAVLIGDELQAALLVLSTDVGGSILSGVLESVSEPDPYVLVVMTDTGGQFNVCVDPDTSVILQVLLDDEAITLFDLLDPNVLEIGSRIEVFGNSDLPPAGCDVIAEQIIVEAPATA